MSGQCARVGCRKRLPSPRARYCSGACQKAAARARAQGGTVVELPLRASSLVAATRAALEAAGRLDHHWGQAAMLAAERLENSRALVGAAPLLKEYRDTMVEALKDVEQHSDTVDEIRAAALRLLGS